MSRYGLRETDLVWREADGEIVVLDLKASVYVSMNRSARVLWERLAEGADRSDLVDVLQKRYGISAEIAGRDVDAFLQGLQERAILVDRAEPSPDGRSPDESPTDASR
jgi:hypothetical protein